LIRHRLIFTDGTLEARVQRNWRKAMDGDLEATGGFAQIPRKG